MKRKFFPVLLTFVCLFAAVTAHAQSANAGDIRGTATDPTGALLPDVSVTVLNTRTGVSKQLHTNNDGLYDTGPIVTGNYTITFSKEGFSNFVRTGLNLDVQNVTVNGALKVGGANQEVVVNTDVPLIQTESGEQSAMLEGKTLQELPNAGGNGPNWENFTNLIAGATGTPSAPMGNTPGQSVSVNGNLPYSAILADGAVATLPSSGNADVNVFETIQEVKVMTSAFSAQYGIGGVIFNQITKGGTNGFHGSAYLYNQNDAFNAKPFNFTSGAISKNRVRFNNFGGSIGGPIFRDKAFFYFNYDQIINNSASNGTVTVPTLAQRNGDFSQQLVSGVTCAITTPTGGSSPGCIYDPATQVTVSGQISRKPFAGNIIPSNRFDSVAKNIGAYFPAPNRTGNVQQASFANGTYQQGITTNNYFFQVTQPNPFKKYFGRLDYDFNKKNRLTATVAQRDNPAFSVNQGICPINCFSGDVDSTNAQVTNVTSITSNLINEVRIGYTKQLNFFVGQSFGQGLPAKIGLQYAKADGFPNININNELGIGPGINAIYKEHVFDPSDIITLIKGRHIMHFGGEFLINQDNSTAWGNLNPGAFGYTGDYTKGSLNDKNSGFGYADFLLGQTHDWAAQVQPEYAARQKSPQIFLQDDFKVRPNLTINLGIRYQVQLGWNDAKKNQATFDPTILNSKTNTLGAIWYAANATNGRTSLQKNNYSTVLPRVGFAYTARRDAVVRGGIGIYAYDWSLDQYGNGEGGALITSGNISDSTNGVAPVVLLSGSGANLPYAAKTPDPTNQNGQSVNFNPYDTPVAKILQYNLAIQKQFGSNLSAQVAYVGSHGYNLVFPSNINQVHADKLSSTSALSRPYTQFQGITGNQIGAISNYNSLQLSLTKRFASGFSFDTNYVWSKFLDEADSSGWGSRAGTQVYQDAYNFGANYGPSNFDVRNAWKGNFIYELPFGKGARFLNHNYLVDQVVGGWRLSSTFVLQTGNPFTPTIRNNNDNALSNGNSFRQFPNLVGNPQSGTRTLNRYFNTAAFATPTPFTFGNVRRNSVYGPGYRTLNTSVGKTFHLHESFNLAIRGDINNVLNHPTFGLPNTDIDSGGGVISSTTTQSRNMQLSARFTF